MTVAVLSDDSIKAELVAKGFPAEVNIQWADSLRSLLIIDADAYFDLLFTYDRERISKLKRLLPRPVFVGSVIHTCGEIGNDFIRVNAWPTMVGRAVAEIAFAGDNEEKAAEVLSSLKWPYSRSPDVPGMITPRIVSMIINEAWFALGEKVSSEADIDTAMKLGTNYPYGPFEWGGKIGYDNIRALLMELSKTDSRYDMAPLLKKE